jgi:adenylate kinase
MKSGNLIADEDIVKLVDDRLKKADAKKGYLLDGFPRSLKQAELFSNTDAGALLDRALVLNVDEDALIERLSGRLTCLSCGASFHIKNFPPKAAGKCDNCGADLIQRADDNPESIKQRLKVYRDTTEPVIEYYKHKGLVVEIDASGSPDDVYSALRAYI